MALVAILGVAAWLGIEVVRVARDENTGFAVHLLMRNDTRQIFTLSQIHPGYFWTRYAQRLTGGRWPAEPACVMCKTHYEKMFGCEVVEIESSATGDGMMEHLQRLDTEYQEAKLKAELSRLAASQRGR